MKKIFIILTLLSISSTGFAAGNDLFKMQDSHFDSKLNIITVKNPFLIYQSRRLPIQLAPFDYGDFAMLDRHIRDGICNLFGLSQRIDSGVFATSPDAKVEAAIISQSRPWSKWEISGSDSDHGAYLQVTCRP